MFKVNELLKATRGRLFRKGRDASIRGISVDSRTISPQEAFIAIKGANFNGHDFIAEAINKGARAIIAQSSKLKAQSSKKNKIPFILVKDTTMALGDIARFQREKFDIPVIAVTGSSGKTTTKDMIAWVLSRRFKVLKNIGTQNNHIGLPLTLLNLDNSVDFAVLELGTNHFGEIEYLAKVSQPNMGIITNIGPAHLEYLGNLRGVLREKYSLLRHLINPKIALLNADDSLLNRNRINKTGITFGFGVKNLADFSAKTTRVLNGKIEFLVNQKYRFTLKTLGYYNIYNALAAITVARIFGMGYKDIASRLTNFKFPQDRLQSQELNNIKFINDTYNSNPVSLKQALESLRNFRTKGRKIFVMGDMLELGKLEESFHRQAGRSVVGVCDTFITVGRLSKLAAKAAKACGFNTKNIFTCESNIEAKDILFKKISLNPDDIVLVKGSRAMKMEEILKKA